MQCKITDCDRKVLARSMCQRHYDQWRHSLQKPEYMAWQAMITRCTNPRQDGWKNYGGRGVTVCDEWRHSFQTFFAHIGPRPGKGYSVERENNLKGYEPGNVRWATRIEQNQNKRSNINITINGVTRCLREWSRQPGARDHRLILARLHRGWDEVTAIFGPPVPVHGHRPKGSTYYTPFKLTL